MHLIVCTNFVVLTYVIISLKVGDLFLEYGGKLIENTKIVDIKVNADETIKLITNQGSEITCKQLVLCCGAWAGGILKNLNLELPLHPIRVDVPYWNRSHKLISAIHPWFLLASLNKWPLKGKSVMIIRESIIILYFQREFMIKDPLKELWKRTVRNNLLWPMNS